MKFKTFQRKTARAGVEGEQRPALNQTRPFAQPAAPERHAPSASLRAWDGQAAGEGHHFGRVATSPRESARGRAAGGMLPDELRAGVEKLSGVSLADVRVHYGSPRPARMGARAYTQGAEIHVAPGEERHLAHEAWHVVQQKRGRVRANARLGGAGVNTSPALEREADRMGARAANAKHTHGPVAPRPLAHHGAAAGARAAAPIQAKWILREGKPVEVDDSHQLQENEQLIDPPQRNDQQTGVQASTSGSSVSGGGQSVLPTKKKRRRKVRIAHIEEAPLLGGNQGGGYGAVNNNNAPMLNALPQMVVPQVGGQQVGVQQGNIQQGVPQQGGNQQDGIGLNEVGNFITANSPGIYTGATGGLGATSNATSLLNVGVSRIPGPVGHSVSQGLNTTSNILGIGGAVGTGGSDVLAMGRSIYDVGSATGTLWDQNASVPQKELARSKRRAGLADLGTQAVDTGSQTSSMIGTFAHHGSALATHAGQAAPFLSTAVGTVVGARAGRRAWRARGHEQALASVPRAGMSQGMQDAVNFSQNQMKKRKRRNIIGGVGAGIGAAGGLMLGLGALGVAATALTPIGWALAAIGGGVALGMGIHKAYRWYQKKYKNKGQPNELGRERETHADALHAAVDPTHPNHNPADLQHATQILTARGIQPAQVQGPGGKDFIKRRLESW